MDVQKRNIGPPPFNAPSGNMDLGPYAQTLVVILSSGNSERIPLPFVMSDEACTVTGKPPGRQTETSPAAVCSEESVKTPWLLTNSTVIGPAPVSTCAPWPRLYSSTLPPPVETCTRPLALARRTLPPPVSARTAPLTSPKKRLPPSVLARRSPSHLRTSIPPPPVVIVEPFAVPIYTLPPPSVTRA